MRLVDVLARIAACCIGGIAALETWSLIEREVRFRSVVRTFASTREVVPNVRGRGNDPHRGRTGTGIR
jgi:hypothetical protein